MLRHNRPTKAQPVTKTKTTKKNERQGHMHTIRSTTKRSFVAKARTASTPLNSQSHYASITVPSFSSTTTTTNQPAPTAMLNTRQLHPSHIFGHSERPKPQFERSPVPSDPVIPSELKPTHIQYISGYQFMPIDNVKQVKSTLHKTLSNFGVTGRIYMNHKGVNLQMCAHPKDTQEVISAVRGIENGIFAKTRIFANDIVDTAEVPALFDRLSILERTILNDGLDEKYSEELNPFIEKFNHLEPDQWHQTLKTTAKSTDPNEKPIVLDIRNLYEYELGSFEAIAVDVDAYRDTFSILDTILGIQHPQNATPYHTPDTTEGNNPQLIQRSQLKRKDAPDAIRNDQREFETQHQRTTIDIGKKLQALYPASSEKQSTQPTPSTETLPPSTSEVKIDKNKKLMLYCTGGIRCLKVGSYLHHQGFTDVNVLNGGINAYSVYAQKNPEIAEESLFSGSNVVFDHRRAVTVGKKVLSHCHQCDELSNIQRNCVSCDVLFLQCKSCEELYSGACSIQCSEDAYGLGEHTRSVVKAMGLRPIVMPPEKSRIRPRLTPYSITQNAPYLDNIDIMGNQLDKGVAAAAP